MGLHIKRNETCAALDRLFLWLKGAALQEQRLDGGVALLPRGAQRHFIVRVDVCAPVKQESNHLQLTQRSCIHQGLAVQRLNICAAIQQESSSLQVAVPCSDPQRKVLLRMYQ